MPLHLIKGHYRLQSSEPDGDSVHFHPANPDAFTMLHLGAHLSSQGATQLRLEGIDALETHYSPRVADGFLQHQPWGWPMPPPRSSCGCWGSATSNATANASPPPPLTRPRATS
jgi:hypothetical protein